MPLSIGENFAGYRVLRLLGFGGMGEVYLVQHPRLPRQDALKILRPEFSRDASFRARFIREADLAAGLRHPHIVGIHDRGEHDGQLWIAMDYIEGADLSHLLSLRYPAGLPVSQVVTITTAVASALDYAHKKGLLHRDIKPANVIVADLDTGSPTVFVADFGIARPLDDASGITTTNVTIGTVAYSAPEQLMGEPMDGRSDQYALAATTYHLLTGSQLFPDSNPAVIISRHLNSPPPALARIRPELRDLDPVITLALSKDPDERFPCCADFARALSECASGAGGSSSATTKSRTTAAKTMQRGSAVTADTRQSRPHTKRRWLTLAALAGAVIIAAGISLLITGPGSSPESTTTPPSSGAALPGPARQTTTGESKPIHPPETPVATPPATEPVISIRTALPFCYDSTPITVKPSSGGLLCKGHWFENMTWTSWGPDAADGTGIEALKGCTPSCAEGELSRYPVELHFSGPAPPPTDSTCPVDLRFYTQLIVAYPTSQPPSFPEYDGGPIVEKYNGMPSLRWNGLRPYCY